MTGPGWTVHTSWRATATTPACEFSQPHPDWRSARQAALALTCVAGARYLTIHDPGDVVVAEWDRYTNRWREYLRPFGVCGAEREPDGQVCTTELWIAPSALQVRCPTCRAWQGADSRPYQTADIPTVPSRA